MADVAAVTPEVGVCAVRKREEIDDVTQPTQENKDD